MARGGAGDYYDELGVSTNASKEEITRAYRTLVARYHPDRHQGNDLKELAGEKLQRIKLAHEVLSDPHRRAAYNVDPLATGVHPVRPVGHRSSLRLVLRLVVLLACIPLLMRLIQTPQQLAVVAGLMAALWVGRRMWRAARKRGE